MLIHAFSLLLLLTCLLIPALPATSSDSQQLFSFAETLYSEQDYYRAITEYKRFLHLEPSSPQADTARLRIGQSLLAGERWQEAEHALQQLLATAPQDAVARQAALLLPEISYRQQRYSLASEQFRQLTGPESSPQIRDQARYRLAWSEIEQQHFNNALSELNQLDSPQADSLAAALAARQPVGKKSPGLAGTLSTILPGAGQLYTGQHRDAGLAFALNAAFIWATIEAFQNDNEVLGGILGFFEIGWYGGNIYNAVNHAHHYNQRLLNQEKVELQQRFGIDLKLGPKTSLLQLHGRF